MRRRDPIFWAAAAIFVLAIVLAGVAGDSWLLLLVGSYLLRPTLHSLGFFRKLVDEREMEIQYRAGNVGFVAMIIGVIVVMLILMSRGDHTWEMLNAVLMVALAARALAGLLMVGDLAVAGPRIVMAVGFLLALFGVVEGGAEVGSIMSHIIPGLGITGLGFVARRFPRPVAALLLVAVAALAIWLVSVAMKGGGAPMWGTVLAVSLIAVPLAVAAVCLLRAGGDDGGVPAAGAIAFVLVAALAGALASPTAAFAQDPRFDCKERTNRALGRDCRLLKEGTVYGRRMPAGAILHYDSTGTYTFFYLKTPGRFEGFDLASASDGISHDVYPDGSPRGLWLAVPQEVNGVPCRAFSVLGELFKRTVRARFHPSGQFAGCRLSRAATIQGTAFSKGDLVQFDEAGKLARAPR